LEGLDDFDGYLWNIYHVPWLSDKSGAGPLQEVPEYFHRTIDLVRAAVGNSVSVHGEVFSPFTHFMELFGYEEALMGLLSDPAKAHALLERLTAASLAWGVAQARRDVDAVLISSAFAGSSFISRELYREFVAPYERRLAEAIQREGVPVYTHTCGKIGDRAGINGRDRHSGRGHPGPAPLGQCGPHGCQAAHRPEAVYQRQSERRGATGVSEPRRNQARSWNVYAWASRVAGTS